MPIQRIKRKIEQLKEEPEDVRMRAATRFTFISGVALVAMWLLLFLPFQLWLNGAKSDSGERESVTEAVLGIWDERPNVPSPSPTMTPSPTPIPYTPLLNTHR